MARYTGPVCKLCRREGQKLFLKGSKCLTEKCPVTARSVREHPSVQVVNPCRLCTSDDADDQ